MAGGLVVEPPFVVPVAFANAAVLAAPPVVGLGFGVLAFTGAEVLVTAAPPPPWLFAAGVCVLGDGELQTKLKADGTPLHARAGNVRAFVASAVRGAISERRPVSRALVALLEDGKMRHSPVAALALVLAPALIWNRDAAILFRRDAGHLMNLSATSLDRALSLARRYVGDEQIERVRTGSRRLGRELPLSGLPTASDTLSRGCELVASDDAKASPLAALSLVAYAQIPPRSFVLPTRGA